MTFPALRDWFYSAKTFGAAVLALFVAFRLDLPHPYWALTTAYIIGGQPFAGATRARAIWRLAGTFAGGACAIAVLPNFADAPPLLSLILAIWVALCLALSMRDPTPRSYVFILAGYTAAIIAFPSVDAPESIFDTAISRCEEISIGVLCAWLVHSVVFPRRGVPILRQRLITWMGDVARFGAAALHGHVGQDRLISERRRMAHDGAALHALFRQARYELSGNAGLLWLPALHDRARLVPALITFTAERAASLRQLDRHAHAALQPLLDDTARWLAETSMLPLPEDAGPAAERLLARIRLAAEAARSRCCWAGVLEAGIASRLTELVESWRDCAALGASALAAEPGPAPRVPEGARIPGDTDPLMVALSAAAALLSVLAGCAFWIGTGWANGSSVPVMAAITTCLLAPLDDPAPGIVKFLAGGVLSLLFTGILLFGIMPAIDGFPLLALSLSLVFIPAAALQAVPAFAQVSTAVTIFAPTLLALQDAYSADFVSFADNGAATVLGITLALIINNLLRSFGTGWRERRLAEADQRDLLRLVEGRPGELGAILAMMLDRFEALAARLTALDPRSVGVTELADLRAAINVWRLREHGRQDASGLGPLIAEALAALGAELRGRGMEADTLARLDAALNAAMELPEGAATEPALSLAGLRLARFPDAPPPPPASPPEDNALRSLAA